MPPARVAQQQRSNAQAMWQIRNAAEALEQAPEQIEWNDSTIRQLVDTVKVLSKDKIEIYLRGGTVIEQDMI